MFELKSEFPLLDKKALPLGIRCREIEGADIDGVLKLLAHGLRNPHRSHRFWKRALQRLSAHPTPFGLPKYGYLLEHKGVPIGVILLIFASILVNGEPRIRCNVSSWYVEPAFRGYAAMLASRALKHKHVTYFNITPASHTLPILVAQRYIRYCAGRFVSIPALSACSSGWRVARVPPETRPGEDLPESDIELLLAHANYGCVSLICSREDRRYPFVFVPGRKFGFLPYAYLVYCRDLAEFVRFAGPLGRYLARRGFPLVVLDSNGPVSGLIGRYSANFPKYFKGPDQPRLGDLAYSERALFGF
jgi:hypothetical protein